MWKQNERQNKNNDKTGVGVYKKVVKKWLF